MVALLNLRTSGLQAALPILGAFALGTQRLLRLLQNGFSNWMSSPAGTATLIDIMRVLRLPEAKKDINSDTDKRLKFEKDIATSNVGITYLPMARFAPEGISMKTPKGAHIGFAGRTGSGKSSFMDLVLGLINPTEGSTKMDGEELTGENCNLWQKRLAHVPQSIYLLEVGIGENVACGVPLLLIDRNRLEMAASRAELTEVFSELLRQ